MYGDEAYELVKELNRAAWLPGYREDVIRRIIKEIDTLYGKIESTLHAEGFEVAESQVACGLIVHWQCVLHNKRCVLAYLNYRINQLKDFWWKVGLCLPTEVKENISKQEQAFLEGYGRIVRSYQNVLDIDINLDMEPPTSLYTEIRVLKPCGTIQTENGPISLEVNSTHLVRKHDIELLIHQGLLQEIT